MTFIKLRDIAKEPVRSTQHSAGLDIFVAEETTVGPRSVVAVPTGITFDLEASDRGSDWFMDLRLRSSLALNGGVILANGAGVIDKDYAGKEIKVLLYNHTDRSVCLTAGYKIAQLVILEHFSNSAKGVTFKYDKRKGGCGSTGS